MSLIEKRTKWILVFSFLTLLILVVIAGLLSYPEFRKRLIGSVTSVLSSPTTVASTGSTAPAATTTTSSTSTAGSTGTSTTTSSSTTTSGSTTTVAGSGTGTGPQVICSSDKQTYNCPDGTIVIKGRDPSTCKFLTTAQACPPITTIVPISPSNTLFPIPSLIPVCGNGVKEVGEICETKPFGSIGIACKMSTGETGVSYCIDCRKYSSCTILGSGGGVICSTDSAFCADGSEVSKDPNNNCEWQTCKDGSTPGVCGDGERNGPEQCDAGKLNTYTCTPRYDLGESSCIYCSDGSDGRKDCTQQVVSKGKDECNDGIDNSDQDGFIDGEDPECQIPGSTSESQEIYCLPKPGQCEDGMHPIYKDNGCTFIECRKNEECPLGFPECKEGTYPIVDNKGCFIECKDLNIKAICNNGIRELGESCDGGDFQGDKGNRCDLPPNKGGKEYVMKDKEAMKELEFAEVPNVRTKKENTDPGLLKCNECEIDTKDCKPGGELGDIIKFTLSKNVNGKEVLVEHTLTIAKIDGSTVSLVLHSQDEESFSIKDGEGKVVSADPGVSVFFGVDNTDPNAGTATITIAVVPDNVADQFTTQQEQNNIETSPQAQDNGGADAGDSSTIKTLLQNQGKKIDASAVGSITSLLVAAIGILGVLVIFVFTRLAGTIRSERQYPQ